MKEERYDIIVQGKRLRVGRLEYLREIAWRGLKPDATFQQRRESREARAEIRRDFPGQRVTPSRINKRYTPKETD